MQNPHQAEEIRWAIQQTTPIIVQHLERALLEHAHGKVVLTQLEPYQGELIKLMLAQYGNELFPSIKAQTNLSMLDQLIHLEFFGPRLPFESLANVG